jgi:DNA-binding response OmpR family regulator
VNPLLSPAEPTADGRDKTSKIQRERRIAASRALKKTGSFLRLMVGRQGLRVMVTDNDQESADDIAWRLHCWGHDSIVTYDGASALRSAGVQRPQVVLLNLEMSCIDGLKVARYLRLDFATDECFIIGVTRHTDDQQREASIPAGVDLLLIKPVKMMVLETLLMLECDRVHRMQVEKNARTNGRSSAHVTRVEAL